MEDNARSRIDDYLDEVFAPHEDVPAVAELRMEIRCDLMDRLDDLTAQGVSDDAAYDQVVASLGDLHETIADLVAAQPTGAEAVVEGVVGESPAGFPLAGMSSGSPVGSQAAGTPTGSPTESRAAGATADPSPEPPRSEWDDWEVPFQDRMEGLRTQIQGVVDGVMKQVEDAIDKAQVNTRRSAAAAAARVAAPLGQNYSASDLHHMSYAGMDLTGWRFNACNLRSVDFTGATLVGASLRSCTLRDATFADADLTGAALKMSSMRGVTFDHARLVGTDLAYGDLRGMAFVGNDLSGARLSHGDLRGARFSDCRLDETDFAGSDLREAVFDGLALNNVRFNDSALGGASFVGATLTNVSFRRLSRRSTGTMRFGDTTMDRLSYNSLLSNGYAVGDGLTVTN